MLQQFQDNIVLFSFLTLGSNLSVANKYTGCRKTRQTDSLFTKGSAKLNGKCLMEFIVLGQEEIRVIQDTVLHIFTRNHQFLYNVVTLFLFIFAPSILNSFCCLILWKDSSECINLNAEYRYFFQQNTLKQLI